MIKSAMEPNERQIYREFREKSDTFRGSPDEHVEMAEKLKSALAVKYDLTFQMVNDILSKGILTDLWDAFGDKK